MTRARELAFIANENLLTGDTTNSRIGIGSTVPASALDVKGSISATGDADFSGNITIGGTLTYQDVTNVDAVGIITANSGIHITGGGLRVVGVTTGLSVSGVLTTGNGLTNDYIKIGRTGNFVIDTVSGNNKLRIDPSGILEIGGGNNSGLVVSGVSTITSNINVGVGGTTAFFNIASGNIGIGTDNPQEKLHIHEGDVVIGQDSGSNTKNRNYIKFGRVDAPKAAIGFINNAGSGRGDIIFMSSSDANNSAFNDSDEKTRITQNGMVGIGTSVPAAKLEIQTTNEAALYITDNSNAL